MFWIDNDAVRDRANRLARWLFIVTHAFRAFVWIDFVDLSPERNGFVRALWIAHVAVNALLGDQQCHILRAHSLSSNRVAGICPIYQVAH